MRHLSPGDFVDLVEGVRSESSLPHLAGCVRCRSRLDEMRETIEASARADVPEPSPLFWDRLSARVREAVEDAAVSDRQSVRAWLTQNWRLHAAAGVAACVVAAVVVTSLRPRSIAPLTAPVSETAQEESRALTPAVAQPGPVRDPSFDLVADFGGTLDWDDLREQMVDAPHAGGLDATVGALDLGERRELERLLKEELAHPAGRG